MQVALYVQGLRYHKSRARTGARSSSSGSSGGNGAHNDHAPFTSGGGAAGAGLMGLGRAGAVLRALAQEERRRVYEDRLAAKRLAVRRRLDAAAAHGRRERLRLEAAVFGDAHALPHLPTLLTPFEVDALNRARPPDDQLELTVSGLLRHHCSFPACPRYLQNLATPADARLGFRNGLFRHLKYYTAPDRAYWPNLHVQCAAAFRALKLKRGSGVPAPGPDPAAASTAASEAAPVAASAALAAHKKAFRERVLRAYPDDAPGRRRGPREQLVALVDAIFDGHVGRAEGENEKPH